MAKRNYIFDTIKSVFRKYGYQQIETPSMENLSTLMGKYGDEGDKLIFKILNSGDVIDSSLLSKFDGLISLLETMELKVDVEDVEPDEYGHGNKDKKVIWEAFNAKS